MINKCTFALVISLFLGGCIPINGGYYGGYYPNQGSLGYNVPSISYNDNNMAESYPEDLFGDDNNGYNFNQGTSEVSYSGGWDNQDTTWNMRQRLAQQQQIQQMPNQGFMNNSNQYLSKGIVGVGDTLTGTPQVHQQPVSDQGATGNKLVMPSAWRMAHPSIGTGLELMNQAERFDLNNKLNNVKIQEPVEIKVGGHKVSVLSVNATGVTNLQGFLCKEVYLIKSGRTGNIQSMWGKFCRHPNWNEWVLTKW